MRFSGIAAVSAASLALTACATMTKGGAGAGGGGGMPTATYPIGACSGVAPSDPSELYVITLGPGFKLTEPDVTHSGHPRPNPNHPRPHPNRLDIVTDLQDGQSAVVKIVLADPLLSFPGAGLAIQGADPNVSDVFCDAAIAADGRSLTFTDHRAAGKATYGSYVLGLVATDHQGSFQLPVFIDPGVDNDGFRLH